MTHNYLITKIFLFFICIWMIPMLSFAQFGADYSSYGFNFVDDTNNDGFGGWQGADIGNTAKLNIYKQSTTQNDYALEMKAQNQTVSINYDDTGYMDLNPCSFVINLRLNLTQYTGNQDRFSFKLQTGSKLIDIQFQNNGIYYLDNNNATTLITAAPSANQWFTYTISLDGCGSMAELMIENDATNIFSLNLPDNSSAPSIELSTFTNGSTEFETEIDHLFIYSNPIKWWLGPSTPYVDETNYVGTTGDRHYFLSLPNGERIGINKNGGGYIPYTQLSPTGPNINPNPKFGSGSTKTLRSYFHSADYNPVQPGASSTTGGHLVTVNDLTYKLEVDPYPLHLYYKSGITENNPLVFPSGGVMTNKDNTTVDHDVYDEFGLDMRHELITELDFTSSIEDVSLSGGASVVKHLGEWEFIRHPCQLLQYHEPDANPRYSLDGTPHSDSDMGEMRHKFEFRMNKDLGYKWVLWRENGAWQSLELTTVGQKKTFESTNVAAVSLENRFMVFSTSDSLTDPNAIAFYYPESNNANSTLQKSRTSKSIVSQEDRRFKIQITADWRKTNWCRMNLYIFNKGLLAPNHGNPNEYESFRMEAHQIFGTPEQIWAQVQGFVLPVELISFEVEQTDENQVAIQWKTASEINHDYFTIERSKDGSNWEAIERVNSTSSMTTTVTNYSTIDESPIVGLSFYRLKQTDLDGTTAYSSVKSMSIDHGANSKIAIYPNPTDELVNIELNGLIVEKMILVDNAGNDLTTKVRYISTNEERIVLNLEQLPIGTYYLVLNERTVKKVQRK